MDDQAEPQQQEAYTEEETDALREMLNSPGWEVFATRMAQMKEANSNLANISNAEQFWKNKGKVEVLDNILLFTELGKTKAEITE